MVPGSTSPDGKTALYYFHDPTKELNEGYELLFADIHSGLPASGDLMPAMPSDMTTDAAMQKQDMASLLGGIAVHYEAGRQHVLWDPGFTYDVIWSPDGQRVAIEGGAHKFWKALVYHHRHGDYESVELPDPAFEQYFDEHHSPVIMPDRGAAAAIRKVSSRNYDYPNICWLGNSEIAINAYPYLLLNTEYGRMENHGLFFTVDVRNNPATITGFCR